MNWEKTLGEEWTSLLESFLKSSKMNHIIKNINYERSKYVVYPKINEFYKMFKIFKDLQPSDIKVVILGQDPYPDNSGTGYSFCNSEKLPSKISPSLRNILKEIKSNDTEKDKLVLDLMDLQRLVKQGVFLANVYLTVRKNVPGAHSFWKPFAIEWIRKLNIYNDVIWLLWGRKAQEYEKFIVNSTHEIIKTSHPSPLGATKEGVNSPAFIGSNCFEKVNNALWVRNKPLIKW